MDLKSLGDSKAKWSGFETFKKPEGVSDVRCISSEITAVCPVTGHPDFYTVDIFYQPRDKCVESKTLKLYLQKFRETGIFCEAFASTIAKDIMQALDAYGVEVEVIQVPRGGVGIKAKAYVYAPPNE